MNPRNSAPILEDDGNPDVKLQMESANELLEIWEKGQTHLNEFWKHWYNHYLLSLRKQYQTCLQEPRIKSRMNPMVGQIIHIKEDPRRSKWRMEKIAQLIESRGNKIHAASVLLPNGNTIKRSTNLLYLLETTAADIIGQNVEDNFQKENRPNNISVE